MADSLAWHSRPPAVCDGLPLLHPPPRLSSVPLGHLAGCSTQACWKKAWLSPLLQKALLASLCQCLTALATLPGPHHSGLGCHHLHGCRQCGGTDRPGPPSDTPSRYQAAPKVDGAPVTRPCTQRVMCAGPHPPSSTWTVCSWRLELVRSSCTHEARGTRLLDVCQGTSLACRPAPLKPRCSGQACMQGNFLRSSLRAPQCPASHVPGWQGWGQVGTAVASSQLRAPRLTGQWGESAELGCKACTGFQIQRGG